MNRWLSNVFLVLPVFLGPDGPLRVLSVVNVAQVQSQRRRTDVDFPAAAPILDGTLHSFEHFVFHLEKLEEVGLFESVDGAVGYILMVLLKM